MDSENDKGQIQFRFIIVPDFVIQDTSIPEGEKLLFGEIASNSLEKGFCWFSNKYLMQRFNIGERTASRWVNDLKHKGYINVVVQHRNNSKEIEERQIRVNTSQKLLNDYMKWYRQKRQQGIDNFGIPPIAINGAGNNKQENNKDLINLKDISNVFLSQAEYQSLIDEFGKEKFETGINAYSNWKHKVNAHPKSDFDSLKKWLSKALNQYKGRVSSVKESGADEVTDEMLTNLPF
ncbi:MAG: helix-turn-helix domain-containing protein [Treponemataceae bacterium]|nr:helix-turn-helix domain-containing protein [Treponemataceae bacterium]